MTSLSNGRWSRRQWLARSGMLLGWGCWSVSGCHRPADGSLLQLNWFPDAQHGGFYSAVLNQHVQQAGWTLQVQPGGPSIVSLSKLVLGQVDFAIASADQVLMARAQDADIVPLFAALQTSPRCVMVHEASGITRWEELGDVVLAMGEGQAFAEYLKLKLPLSGVKIVPYSGDIGQWMTDKKYAQQAYVFSEPLLARRAGGDPRVLMVSDLGFNPYTSVLVTSGEKWRRDETRLRAFLGAIRAGWRDYLSDPVATHETIHAANPTMELEVLAEAVNTVKELALAGLSGPEQLGTMQVDRWRELEQQMLEMKILERTERDWSQVVVAD